MPQIKSEVMTRIRANSATLAPNPTAPLTLAPVLDEVEDEVDQLSRSWLVIVWDDPVNLMSYVTYVFMKLFGQSMERATQLMLQVHNEGKAVVASGTKEKAELDVFRLHEHGLWATMQLDA